MLSRGWRQLRHTEGAVRRLLQWVYGPAGHSGMERKRNHNEYTLALSSPGISEGSERSCEHIPMANPQPPSRVSSRMLCTPLTALWHNSCTSPVLARIETLEINDQKKESIWEIKALC